MSGSSSWLGRASGALGALLAIAIVARVVWELLEPLLPLLGGLLVVFWLLAASINRRRYW